MLTPFLALALIPGSVADAVPFAQLVENLSRLRTTSRTVEIEFKLERRDAVFHKKQTFTGKFVSLREDSGFYATLQFRSDDNPEWAETFVLRGDELTLWDTRTKTVTSFRTAKTKGGYRFAVDNYCGLLWLLDREGAGKQLKATAFKRAANYTYYDVKVDEYPMFSLLGQPKPIVAEYRLAMTMSASDDFPKHTIRQIYQTKVSGDTELYKVTKWVVDSPDYARLTADKIPDPAKPPEGWTVRP